MRKLIFAIFTAFAVAGCSTPRAADAPSQPATPPPQPYMRVARPDTNTVQLQIAVRKFVPVDRRGPTIWLAGTSHIGEPEYYHALQKHLDAQTIVLYEGVNADAHPRHVRQSRPRPSAPVPPRRRRPPPTRALLHAIRTRRFPRPRFPIGRH